MCVCGFWYASFLGAQSLRVFGFLGGLLVFWLLGLDLPDQSPREGLHSERVLDTSLTPSPVSLSLPLSRSLPAPPRMPKSNYHDPSNPKALFHLHPTPLEQANAHLYVTDSENHVSRG